ncbi:hypothetical protein H4S07_001937 [Coemansia furcata]|uniref:Uncharacterized protein n=1 Tax=Coemansia furcata TaxID=417177 RepID=A0ACC1LM27_9FUNG|nr:hypothetical protein H4S07_001937 [Coemansia furcata]
MQIKYGLLGGKKAKGKTLLPERKYFDSGDYALSKAGKSADAVGEKHPSPESIPHQQLAAAAAAQVPPPLAGSSSSIGGLPIVSGVGISVGAAGTMANPSGLSPPVAHHLGAVSDEEKEDRSPNVSEPPAGVLPPLGAVDSAHLGQQLPVPGAPGARPAFVRRVSQTPAGMQYRVKN